MGTMLPHHPRPVTFVVGGVFLKGWQFVLFFFNFFCKRVNNSEVFIQGVCFGGGQLLEFLVRTVLGHMTYCILLHS
jgi:hypothetical protein